MSFVWLFNFVDRELLIGRGTLLLVADACYMFESDSE